MSVCEILFKVRDSGRGGPPTAKNYLDGMPVIALAPGVYFTPREMWAWIKHGRRPANASKLQGRQVWEWELTIRRCRYSIGRPNIREVADLRYPRARLDRIEAQAALDSTKLAGDDRSVYDDIIRSVFERERISDAHRMELARNHVQTYVDMVGRFRTEGADSAWGSMDRRNFGILIADLSFSEHEDLLSEPTILDATEHPFAKRRTWARRRFLVDYENVLSVGTVAMLRDTTDLYQVPRGKVRPLCMHEFAREISREELERMIADRQGEAVEVA